MAQILFDLESSHNHVKYILAWPLVCTPVADAFLVKLNNLIHWKKKRNTFITMGTRAATRFSVCENYTGCEKKLDQTICN